MNVTLASTYVTGDVIVPVYTAIHNSIVNINIVNTGDSPVFVTVYIGGETPPQKKHIIDNKQALEIGRVLLRCGEPIAQNETIFINIENQSEELNDYGVSVRISGLFDEPIA